MFSFHVVKLWQSKNWANCPCWIYTMSWCNDHTSPETSTEKEVIRARNSIHSLWVCKHLRGWVDHQQLELIDRGIHVIWWTCGKSMLGHNVGQVVRLVWSRHAMFSDDLNFQAISYRCVWICVDHNCKTQLEQVWEVSRQQARRHTVAMPIKKQRVCSY